MRRIMAGVLSVLCVAVGAVAFGARPVAAASYYRPCDNSMNLVVQVPRYNVNSGDTIGSVRCQSGRGVAPGEVFIGFGAPIRGICLVRTVLHFPVGTYKCTYGAAAVYFRVPAGASVATQLLKYPSGYVTSGDL